MELVKTVFEEQIVILLLNRGITNALDAQFVQVLAEQVQRAEQDPAIHGLVLASANDKFFSIGLDIPSLYVLSREDFAAFYRHVMLAALQLYTLPKPTVAAITGHATAGGCILALCCDHRYIAQGRKLMGLNEAKLGVPIPYLAECILRQIVGPGNAREVMDTGEFYAPEALLQLGMVDEVLPLEQVLPQAVAKAKALAETPTSFRAKKQRRVGQVEAEIRARLEEKARVFVEYWYSPDARQRLQEAMAKF